MRRGLPCLSAGMPGPYSLGRRGLEPATACVPFHLNEVDGIHRQPYSVHILTLLFTGG
jgi:hypothetical protein